MNDQDIDLIQGGWNRLVGREDEAIIRFYDLLFSSHPEYKPMFTQTEESLRLKFISMLNVIVNGLEHLDVLEAPLIELGIKHSQFNISISDYEVVAEILIQAIDEVSDKPLTDMDKAAWMKGLMLVSSIMDEASRANE